MDTRDRIEGLKRRAGQALVIGGSVVMGYFALGGGLRSCNGGKPGEKDKDKEFPKTELSAEELAAYYQDLSEKSTPLSAVICAIPEDCMTEALYTPADGRWNIAFCLTSMPADKGNPEGKWRLVKAGDACTMDEAVRWTGIYFKKFVYPKVAESLKVKVSENMFLALSDFIYNIGGKADNGIVAALNEGRAESEAWIMFSNYRKAKEGNARNGLLKRRWLEMGVASGALDPKRLLDCDLCSVTSLHHQYLYKDDLSNKERAYYAPDFSPEKIEIFYNKNVPGKKPVREILAQTKEGKRWIKAVEGYAGGGATLVLAPEAFSEKPADKKQEAKAGGKAYAEALKLYRAKDFAGAKARLQEVLQAEPENFNACNDLAITLYRLKDYDASLEATRKAIDLAHRFERAGEDNKVDDVVFAASYYNGGLARMAKGEFGLAEKNFATASARDPGNAEYKGKRADAAAKAKEASTAVKSVAKSAPAGKSGGR